MSAPAPEHGEPLDPYDHRLARSATGLLRRFNQAGVLETADVVVAERVGALAGESDDRVVLAMALAVRAVRAGSVCVDLRTVADGLTEPEQAAGLPWPEVAEWLDALAASPLLAPPGGGDDPAHPPVLRLLDDTLLYLDRYWREESQVLADLTSRLEPVEVEETWLGPALDRVFRAQGYEEQRAAARVALAQRTTVLTGGPGTGKTTTVAALLALLVEQAELAGDGRPRIALAAPTGKAAARLQQAVEEAAAGLAHPADRARVQGLRAVTLHRLLGPRPDTSSRFRHHRDNRLPHDVVVVDETSMVSLTMMARLLESLRPHTRLLLVGDPDQLTSVEAGAVLGDVVRGLDEGAGRQVAALRTPHRFGGEIRSLAAAVRDGDVEATVAVLGAGHPEVVWLRTSPEQPLSSLDGLRQRLLPHARALRRAALAGDAAGALDLLDDVRLLCAHREGPYGVRRWNDQVERWLAEVTSEPLFGPWYAGRPVLVTANDHGLGLYNGDVGVCVPAGRGAGGPPGPGGLRVHVAATPTPIDVAPGRLGDVETMHATTIHKSQGGQAGTVVVVLPPPESRLLTRELLYTAVTRARQRVVLVGSEADVAAAVRRRAIRATGLRERLRHPPE